MKKVIVFIFGFILLAILIHYVFGTTAEGHYALAMVTNKTEVAVDPEISDAEKAWNVELLMLSGKLQGKKIIVPHEQSKTILFRLPIGVHDTLLVWVDTQEEQQTVGIDEFYRSGRLALLICFLIAVILLITGENGMKALIALAITMVLIFGVMSTMLIKGFSPIPAGICIAILITITNLYFIAGWTRKALVAVGGTVGGVIAAGLFAWLASTFLHLTGYTGHETQYLEMLSSKIEIKGILVCGMIIGALGAVMDVAISIASSMLEISTANPGYTRKMLFASGMNIGRDIIGSMTNTLVLAYTGASLSMILIFALQGADFPLLKIMNMEFICAEILRSLAGLLGMALSIPLTALLAAYGYTNSSKNPTALQEESTAE